MKHARRHRVAIPAAILAVIATATTACGVTSGERGHLAAATSGRNGGHSASARVASLIRAGMTQSGRGNWSAATAAFHKVLALEPSNIYANYDLGVIAQSTGRTGRAVSYYNKALADNRTYTPAMYNEAILLESSHPQQAIALYQKIVSINPKASTAYLRMARVQAGRGDLVHARANHAKAVSLDPKLARYSLLTAK